LRLYTIGFTKKSAETFFSALRDSGATRVVDVRIRNVSQLAGFAKRTDLPYFLREICAMDYVHLPILAPTIELRDAILRRTIDWSRYEEEFLQLMRERQVETVVPREVIANACLLCTEDLPHRCHRRLVAQYLDAQWGGVEVVHLPMAAKAQAL
jgi:uncharacterized protein (DUF488 family)